MKKYKITFSLFGIKKKAVVKAKGMDQAVKKFNLDILKQIKVEDVKEEDLYSDLFDSMMSVLKNK